MTPTTEQTQTGLKELRVSKSVFDLDSRDDVTVVKIGQFTPVATMHEFTARLGNDAAKILAVVNEGLEAYDREQLALSDTPWETEAEDGTRAAFSGTLLTEEKSKQLSANVLNMAKMLFGYAKQMFESKTGPDGKTIQVPLSEKANRDAKKDAKEKAQEMLLSNPAVIEALKK